MRYNEILHEFLIKLDGKTIHRNPLRPQILSMFKDSENRHKAQGLSTHKARLRGVIVAGKMYVWDAWDGIHFEIMEKMVQEGIIDHPDRTPTNVIPSYSGFYLKYRLGISHEYYHDRGIDIEGNRAVLSKFLDRWNS